MMNLQIKLLLSLSLPALALLGAAALYPVQQVGCVTEITALNIYANIRSLPNTTTGQVIGQINKGEYKAVESLTNDWYKLKEGGYVSKSVTTERCTPYTPSPKPPTLTRIPSATLGPTATPRTKVWVEFSNGTLIDCDIPCHFDIYDTLPTRRP